MTNREKFGDGKAGWDVFVYDCHTTMRGSIRCRQCDNTTSMNECFYRWLNEECAEESLLDRLLCSGKMFNLMGGVAAKRNRDNGKATNGTELAKASEQVVKDKQTKSVCLIASAEIRYQPELITVVDFFLFPGADKKGFWHIDFESIGKPIWVRFVANDKDRPDDVIARAAYRGRVEVDIASKVKMLEGKK